MKIINTLLMLLSIFFYPLALTQRYPYHITTSFKFVAVVILIIVAYITIFVPLNANKFFNITYFLLSLLLLYFGGGQKVSIYLVIIGLCQLVICFFAQSDNQVIFNFAIPIFGALMLTYSLFNFISINFLITILLINLLVLVLSMISSWQQELLAICCLSALGGGLFLLNYVSLNFVIVYLIIFGLLLILKHYFKLDWNSNKLSVIRMLISIVILIV